MYLSDSFTAALATAHRDDLIAAAERHRTARHARAAVAAARAAARRARKATGPPVPDPAPRPSPTGQEPVATPVDAGPVHPERNGDANRRYAVSR